MAKNRPSSAADYAEIVIQRRGQPALKGEMWVADGLLTVRSSDDDRKRHKLEIRGRLDWRGSCYWNWKRSVCMQGH